MIFDLTDGPITELHESMCALIVPMDSLMNGQMKLGSPPAMNVKRSHVSEEENVGIIETRQTMTHMKLIMRMLWEGPFQHYYQAK